jgi:hypothetical protein
MGRRKKILTPEEILERKLRWWGPDRNARRRERYQQDNEYRQQSIKQVRDHYRQSRTAAGLDVRSDDCEENISKLAEIGAVRDIINACQSRTLLTFTIEEAAIAFGRNQQVMYRWLKSGLLPPPVLTARNNRNRLQSVYVECELREMLDVFSAHQKLSQYYRSYHVETQNSMFAKVDAAREELEIFRLFRSNTEEAHG